MREGGRSKEECTLLLSRLSCHRLPHVYYVRVNLKKINYTGRSMLISLVCRGIRLHVCARGHW